MILCSTCGYQGPHAPGQCRPWDPPLITRTALARVRETLGRDLDNELMKDIGARAAKSFRAQYKQDPPRVVENHPELAVYGKSGLIAVFAYPGESVRFLDEAIRGVSTMASFVYTPPPLPGYQPPPVPPPKCSKHGRTDPHGCDSWPVVPGASVDDF